jgi:hypothetical protein
VDHDPAPIPPPPVTVGVRQRNEVDPEKRRNWISPRAPLAPLKA